MFGKVVSIFRLKAEATRFQIRIRSNGESHETHMEASSDGDSHNTHTNRAWLPPLGGRSGFRHSEDRP
jgi:hypothetical protein